MDWPTIPRRHGPAASSQRRRLRRRPRRVLLGRGPARARRAARRRGPEHRPRGGRPPRRGTARATGWRCAGSRRDGTVTEATYAELRAATNRFANVLARPRRGAGRPGVHPPGPGPRAVRRGARHPEEHQRLLPAVLGVRPRADPPAARPGRRPGAGHHPGALPAQGRADPRRAAGARARAARRRPRRRVRRRRPRLRRRCSRPRRTTSRSRRPTPRTWRCCTSPAAPPARPRARCTCTRPSSPTTPPAPRALDLHPDDVFWCTADPGWVTGTSYGIIAPLTHGVTSIVDEARLRRRALVPDPPGPAGERLVHGADRAADADAGRDRAWPTRYDLSRCGSSPASASRSTPRRSCGARRRSACRSTTTGGRPRPAGS